MSSVKTPAVHASKVWVPDSTRETPVELVLQTAVMPQRVLALTRMGQNLSRMFRQGSNRGVRRDVASVRGLTRHTAHRAACNRRHNLQQVPRLWIAMQRARHRANLLGEVGRSFSNGARDFRQQLLRCRSNRPGHHREQLAGRHSNQR